MKHATPALMPLFLFLTLCLAVLAGASAPPEDGSATQLIEALGCRGCHRIQGYGGSLARDLTDVGSRMTTSEITSFLAMHRDSGDHQMMPAYATLSSEEIETLSSYLYNLR